MRDVDPFCYFASHASALSGFGGDARSPDPQYCFHTNYLEVRPGQARYELKLFGARAQEGELTVRVHAYRPKTGENASLVAGARLLLNAEGKQDFSVAVRFHALRDVNYAFYGFFSEASDVTVDHLTVTLDEPEGGEDSYIEPPQSALALRQEKREVRPANALVHPGPLRLDYPVSQDCTRAQLAESEHDAEAAGAALARWRETACLNALAAYEVNISGLDGLVVGHASDDMRHALDDTSFIVRHVGESSPSLDKGEFVDFLLAPHETGLEEDAHSRWLAVLALLERLKFGGMAVLGLCYRPSADLASASRAAQDTELSRNEISQWALRLIGRQYSVAPLAFAPVDQLVLDADGLAACILIVRRV